jgi:hypothetical protein
MGFGIGGDEASHRARGERGQRRPPRIGSDPDGTTSSPIGGDMDVACGQARRPTVIAAPTLTGEHYSG